ncbi:MAG TPA: dihydrofolate reductase family protein [Agriterribacter sp.]|nr:dihydrofolate reductase family protein [Agriterribacter sp.]
MNKPIILLTMFTSIDGKIEGDFIHDHNDELGDYFEYMKLEGNDAWGNGSNTHKKYFSDESVDLSKYKNVRIDFEDNIQKGENIYIVSFDSKGKVFWKDRTLLFPEDVKNDVIVVTTKSARPEYIAYLKEKNISYIFAGDDAIELEVALDKLYNLFDIKHFAIVGGATINANFLKADLVDEIKIVIAPFIDGSREQTFAETFDDTRITKQYALKEVKKLEHDGVMITYVRNGSFATN